MREEEVEEKNLGNLTRWTRETAGIILRADKSRDLFREELHPRKLIRRSDSSVPPLDSNLQQAFHGLSS